MHWVKLASENDMITWKYTILHQEIYINMKQIFDDLESQTDIKIFFS